MINEIMFDTQSVKDELGEWLELYNPGDSEVDLSGWSLRDEFSNAHTIDGTLTIAPKQYLVLGRHGGNDNGNYQADHVYGEDFKLANSGDSIILEDADGIEIDKVSILNDTSGQS